jgi:hypothetical protein
LPEKTGLDAQINSDIEAGLLSSVFFARNARGPSGNFIPKVYKRRNLEAEDLICLRYNDSNEKIVLINHSLRYCCIEDFLV